MLKSLAGWRCVEPWPAPGVNCRPPRPGMLELMMRKDKKQVIGEEIGDEPIKLFLSVEPADARPPRFTRRVRASRGWAIDAFDRFVDFFAAAGYDLNAKDARATTLS